MEAKFKLTKLMADKLTAPDAPKEFETKLDRLISEIEPLATRMGEIFKELPEGCEKMTLKYVGFNLTIDKS